jgi:NADH-quinone oxidoreductase subunit C
MPAAAAATLEALAARFAGLQVDEFRGQTRVVVPQAAMLDCITALRDDFGFDLLVDITCVDYLNYRGATNRFGLVYQLANTEDNQRITLRIMLNEPHLTVPSATALWEGADWLEREVYDLFGITFEGHPDLRRILLPDEFTAHPLRKDYPLQGRGERHNFVRLARKDA